MTALGYGGLLGATLLLEGAVVAALAPRERVAAALLACAAGNLITHPLAAGVPALAALGWLGIEACATLAEAVCYRAAAGLSWPRAAACALAANALTAGVGLLLR